MKHAILATALLLTAACAHPRHLKTQPVGALACYDNLIGPIDGPFETWTYCRDAIGQEFEWHGGRRVK